MTLCRFQLNGAYSSRKKHADIAKKKVRDAYPIIEPRPSLPPPPLPPYRISPPKAAD